MGIVRTGGGDAVGEGRQRAAFGIVVDAGEQDDVGVDGGDDAGGSLGLGVGAGKDIAQQQARTFAREFDIEGGDRQGLCGGGTGPDCQQDQAGSRSASADRLF
jgi:hypothetical protein